MTENRRLVEEQLLRILEEAILDEQASYARYKHARGIALEDETRQLLQKLMEDERNHEIALKERYHIIKKQLGLKIINDK